MPCPEWRFGKLARHWQTGCFEQEAAHAAADAKSGATLERGMQGSSQAAGSSGTVLLPTGFGVALRRQPAIHSSSPHPGDRSRHFGRSWSAARSGSFRTQPRIPCRTGARCSCHRPSETGRQPGFSTASTVRIAAIRVLEQPRISAPVGIHIHDQEEIARFVTRPER